MLKAFCFLLCLFGDIYALSEHECAAWRNEHIFNTNERHYFNLTYKVVKFSSFAELNPSCAPQSLLVYSLNLYPTKRMLFFEHDLNIQSLIEMCNFNFTIGRKYVLFHKIKGFNQNLNKTRSTPATNFEFYSINIMESTLDFYLNETRIADQSVCTRQVFDAELINYFGSIEVITFNRNVLYPTRLCPYVFTNSNLKYLSFREVSNSLIFKNRILFFSANTSADLNVANLAKVEIDLAYEHLTLETMNRDVFKHVQIVFISGLLQSIQSNLFDSFAKLKWLKLETENLRALLGQGLQWANYLNKNTTFNLSFFKTNQTKPQRSGFYLEISVVSSVFSKPYRFPNEDICLFKDFPHEQLVYPLIVFQEELSECTCTLEWLTQNAEYYATLRHDTEKKCFSNRTAKKCDFEKMFEKCLSKNSSRPAAFSLGGDVSMNYKFKWLKYVVEVYYKPAFCFLGLLSNSLIILVVTNKRKRKILNHSMYAHILANSVFNLVFCLVSSLSLINICIFPKDSFCSSVYQSSLAQYFKIYVFNFLGNSVRFCCNFSNFTFAVSRYFLSTSNTNGRIYKKIENLNVKIFYASLLALGHLLSLFKIFETKKNDPYNTFDIRFPFDAYDIDYCSEDSLSYSPSFMVKCRVFNILNMINNIVNNVLFLVLSLIIDALLIVFARNYLRQKKELVHEQENAHEHIKEAISMKEKVNKLVLTNNIMYIFSHFPEFITTVLLIVYSKRLASFCFDLFACSDLIEISQSFNFLSIALQIFVFVDFDRNFRASLLDLKSKFANWFKSIKC